MTNNRKSIIADQPQYFHQKNPIQSKNSAYKDWEWTQSIEGYKNEADKLVTCLMRNQELHGHDYLWHVTLYLDKRLTLDSHKLLWQKFCKEAVRKGLIAFWCRETTKRGGIHYHLIGIKPDNEKQVRQIIESSLPDRNTLKFNLQCKPITHNIKKVVAYILKARWS